MTKRIQELAWLVAVGCSIGCSTSNSTSTTDAGARPDGRAVADGSVVVDAPASRVVDAPASPVNDAPASWVVDAPGSRVNDAPASGVDAAAVANADGGIVRAGPGIRPTPENTGVPPGTSLEEIDGDVVVSDDGTVIDAKDIHGFLKIQASHVMVTRSIIRGRAVDNNASVVSISSGSDIVLEDCEIAVAFPSAGVDGFGGDNVIVRRLNIHGGVDGMKVGASSTVEYSTIHDLVSFAHDPNQGGGPTHNDTIQILEGSHIHIVGNSLVAATDQNSAIQITQDFGAVSDVHIESNFADGGGCTYNFAHKGGDSLSDLFTVDNRFGRNSFFNCPILKSTKTTLSSTGDVWDDDGTPVPIQTHD